MNNGQVTIKDIAKELNISPSTVSRALKNHPEISQKTKDRVQHLAKKLDYQPNAMALGLKKRRSQIIGIVLPEIVHYFFSEVISGIEDIARNIGYNVMICQSNESADKEYKAVQTLLSSQVDGLFVSVAYETRDFSTFHGLAKKGMPLIFFDRVARGVQTSKVTINDFKGAYQVTEHLIEQGCRKILHLAGPKNLLISQERLKGYKAALAAYGIRLSENLIRICDNKIRAYEEIKSILNSEPESIDAVFTVNDDTAIGTIQAIKTLGLHVPNDIAVASFGNTPISQIIEPHLTSVSQPGFEMGQSVAKLFVEQLNAKEKGERFVPQQKVLEPQLFIRASSLKK